MLRALGEYHIGGIESNLPLFRAILEDPAFVAGDLDTGYLDRLLRERPFAKQATPAELAPIAALAIAQAIRKDEAKAVEGAPSRWVSEGRGGLLR
jgi:acetyl/propionyl-CoA carboxylase alpha subunit